MVFLKQIFATIATTLGHSLAPKFDVWQLFKRFLGSSTHKSRFHENGLWLM